MKTTSAEKPNVASREQWLKARIELLKEEKELTRRSDELARKRQALPWVPVTKAYRFDTDRGKEGLADLFRGRSQLLVYHFMFGPDYDAGCPSCSSIADSFDGCVTHLANHDVMFWAVSRGPLAKLQEFKKRMGWSFPWASSAGTDFNYDYSVSFTDEQQRTGDIDYNFREGGLSSRENEIDTSTSAPPEGKKIAGQCGVGWSTYAQEAPGMSAFALKDGVIYHTYSTYARGLDVLWSTYQWLDRAPLGRNESGFWFRHHDDYERA
ncbi:MAG TPA: DUF899 domain-containing protein [Opitutaceae bacterium]|nr:DUF899 domain-containing protein [Opitutaceae bacterium]